MNKTSAVVYASTMELPTMSPPLTRRLRSRKHHYREIHKPLNTVPQPTEELILRLNRIGQSYPFCILYKQKANDPL